MAGFRRGEYGQEKSEMQAGLYLWSASLQGVDGKAVQGNGSFPQG